MSVRIRLRRVGRKKQPSYRIVVAESRTPRGGTYLDTVGFYNPRREPVELRVDLAKVDGWVEKGAGLTPTVASLVRRARIMEAAQPAESEAASAAPAAKATQEPVAEGAEATPEGTEQAEAPAAE
jgi:small subunit ribosomal protein S16